MAKKKRIPGPVVVALLFLPVAGMTFWFFYDSDAKRESSKKSAEIVFREAGTVNVLVTADGVPIANANVLAVSHSSYRRAFKRSDEQGQAHFEGLSPGETMIGVRAKGFEPEHREVKVEVDAEQNVEIELERRVEGASPEPAPSASASAADARVETNNAEKP
jgi:hypothetical protein